MSSGSPPGWSPLEKALTYVVPFGVSDVGILIASRRQP